MSRRYRAYLALREAQRSGDEQRIKEAKREYDRLYLEYRANGRRWI